MCGLDLYSCMIYRSEMFFIVLLRWFTDQEKFMLVLYVKEAVYPTFDLAPLFAHWYGRHLHL